MTVKAQALAVLRAARPRAREAPQMDFIEMALRGNKMGFDKVLKLIEDMVETLKGEQADDDKKKEYCEAELDKAEDEKKELARAISVSKTATEELKGALYTW